MQNLIPKAPELIFGLAAPVGTDLAKVFSALTEALSTVNYSSQEIRLSSLLSDIPNPSWDSLPNRPEDVRYHKHMDAGNEFRQAIGRGDALALLAVGKIRDERAKVTGDPTKPIARRAFVLRSLKHPDEVRTLRRIYGANFFLISAYSSKEIRLQYLSEKIAESHHVFSRNDFIPDAEKLILRDAAEVENKFGQNLRSTFPLADVFIDASDAHNSIGSVLRLIEIVFGNPYHTPTRAEFGMFQAQAAALRSAALGRQVGAAITSVDGEVITVGANEVPKAGGGLYWCDDSLDHRDFTLGYDPNDNLKRRLLADVLKRLQQAGWFASEKGEAEIDDLVRFALEEDSSLTLRAAQLMNILEFGRCVHAEMAAIVEAARRGTAIDGAILYSTTFPCHECARHVVAAGIREVFFIEPYPKSLVPELYPDSITTEQTEFVAGKVPFRPFVGVAPRMYFQLFTATERKDKSGRIVSWDKSNAQPRLAEKPFSSDATPQGFVSLIREQAELESFRRQMAENGLIGNRSVDGYEMGEAQHVEGSYGEG